MLLLLVLLFPRVNADFCSQFSDCESCAGRHRVTFEVCHWCPTSNSCVNTSAQCFEGYRTLFDCPRIPQVEYNETFVRQIVTPLIAAAQGTQDQMNQCLGRIEGKLQLWRRFYVTGEDGKERPDGFIAVDFTRRAVIVSFSSVASGARLLYNRFSAEFFTNRQAQFEASNGLVNRLIYDSWFKIWYVLGMENILKQLFHSHPDFELWIFGHAIGGAKADMTAVAVGLKNITSTSKIRLITFGATKVGDQSFVEMIETTVPERFRIINRHDMATRYPKEFDGEWTPPHHHRYEVWYPQGMMEGAGFMVCLGAEDPQCSSRLTPWQLRADDNDVYFLRNINYWAYSGCDENDLIGKVNIPKKQLPTVPTPLYNLTELRTARPYSTTEPPPSLPPTQSTPRITLPPKHLRPLETKEPEVMTTTSLPPSTTTFTTTTRKVFTLPWWYTTQPWSSTTTVPTTSVRAKEWDEGKEVETEAPKKFVTSIATITTEEPTTTTIGTSTTFRSSFRSHTFRPFFEKAQKFRALRPAAEAPQMVEGERTNVFQKISEIEPRSGSPRVPPGPLGQRRPPVAAIPWNQFKTHSQRRPPSEGEEFLTVVDREADQTVSWHSSSHPNNWKLNTINRKKVKRNTLAFRKSSIVVHFE